MRDISLHLLDLMENSLTAGASQIDCDLTLHPDGALDIALTDDGQGMDADMVRQVTDPFTTTRTTRKVGLGIPLTQLNAAKTGGTLFIDSAPGQGTRLTARFYTGHVDCLPLGDLAATVWGLVMAHPDRPEFTLTLRSPQGETAFSTAQIKAVLGPEVPLSEPEVRSYLKDMLDEQTQSVFGGLLT